MKPPGDTKILIAEDDFLISEQIGNMIQQIGYQITGFAQDGKKAVEMAVDLQPDLILMDIRMPKLDGLAASRQINKSCQIPIVVLTAYSSIDLVKEATDAGVLYYLVKPPRLDELERAITVALSRFNDLTELRKTKQELQNSLREKETLMKEIHHRVKNNMNVISSLLGLQMDVVKDEKAKEALKDSQTRVQTMAQIHETLYGSDNLSSIQLKSYLTKLVKSLLHGYAHSENVSLQIEAQDVSIDVKQVSTLGLVANELTTNAIKYAFPDHRAGEITICLRKTDQQIELLFSDNGVGMPAGLDWKNAATLGFKLVRTLVENQLDGSIDMESNNGTKFTIKFKIEP